MTDISGYPATVAEILDDNMKFRPKTIQAVERLKATGPWTGSERQRKSQFRRVHRALCRIYGKRTKLRFGLLNGGSSGSSCFIPSLDLIELRGRLSVVTYLHEFAHALRRNERGACRWSVNLFRKCFPEQFARLRSDGHMLVAVRSHSTSPPANAITSNPSPT